MNSQTARRPDSKRPTRPAKTNKYTRQTARVEARRDGKPLAFGWGGHLSRSEKMVLQRRAVWSVTIATIVLIVAVVVGFWVNVNIIAPAQSITTVNGHGIPLADFRKLLAVKSQLELNKIQGKNGLFSQRDALNKQVAAQQADVDATTKQISTLTAQIKTLPTTGTQRSDAEAQLAGLKQKLATSQKLHDTLAAQYSNFTTNTIPLEQQLYTQPQQSSESATWLQDDEVIREWLATQNSSINAQINPGSSAIDKAVKDFSANFPVGTTYQKFLSTNNVSDNDVRAALALTVRRTNMQTYTASQVVSPTYQVLARGITSATAGDANNLLKQLRAGADFGKLAKAKSVDSVTNTKGGDFGWLARGQYIQTYAANSSGTVENWIFAPSRQLNELSPVLSENGSFHIIQVLGIDPSRAVDSTTLKSLKDNALNSWLMSKRANITITPVDQTLTTDTSIMPPGLPASAPSQQVPGTTPVAAPAA
jgi:parvulin-like peptidyl-prolyl isomerase